MILAIDPGNIKSGWVIYDGKRAVHSGVQVNDGMLQMLGRFTRDEACDLAIEKFEARGMPMGQESIDTMLWTGRFQQAWHTPDRVLLVYRRTVKVFLCGTSKAKDPNVRRALLDLFPATGGGKTPQIGTKSQPGPLFGVSTHAWSALAVAVTSKGAPC